LTPAQGAAVRKAAKAEGVAPAKNLATLKVEGDDAPGLAGRITTAIAAAGVNLRGVSAAAVGKKFVGYFGFDNAADATKAARTLRALASSKKPGKAGR
ncbi:MAG: ACT domain-containing protein, partial [Terrimicrobiaceae bacterium]